MVCQSTKWEVTTLLKNVLSSDMSVQIYVDTVDK